MRSTVTRLATPRTAMVLFGVGLIELSIAIVGIVAARNTGLDLLSSYVLPNGVIGSCGFALSGLLIAVKRPDLPIGWLFLASSVASEAGAAVTPWVYYSSVHWSDTATHALATLFCSIWPFPYFVSGAIAMMLFPDGRFISRGWRYVVGLQVLTYLGWILREELSAAPHGLTGGQHSFLTTEQWPAVRIALDLADAMLALATCGAIMVSLLWRYRHGSEHVRNQLPWLFTAFLLAAVLNVSAVLTGSGPALFLLAFELIPVSVAIAILQHQLFDIRLVLSRSLIYLTLTGLVIAAYTGMVALGDVVVPDLASAGQVAAALLVALAFNPVRLLLQARVSHLLYGVRNDPVRALTAVSSGLEASGIEDLLDSLRSSLRLPYLALHTPAREYAAGAVDPRADVGIASVGLDGVRGRLLIGLRHGERELGKADAKIISLVAPPLAVAVRTAQLSEQLQDTHEQLVLAREEERRRIRRDLHDGLGPALSGFALTVDAAVNQLATAPEETRRILDRLRLDMASAIDDIRQLIYGLRPPSLDDLGLIEAVRAQAARLDRRADGTTMTVTIDGPDALPRLPAAVEVAAYRIATEALNNVARHSAARSAKVTLSAGAALELTITDDGGNTGEWRPGVGLESMTTRARELGGTCTAGPTLNGGVVHAHLPLAEALPLEP